MQNNKPTYRELLEQATNCIDSLVKADSFDYTTKYAFVTLNLAIKNLHEAKLMIENYKEHK